jgi:hypothetical protein
MAQLQRAFLLLFTRNSEGNVPAHDCALLLSTAAMRDQYQHMLLVQLMKALHHPITLWFNRIPFRVWSFILTRVITFPRRQSAQFSCNTFATVPTHAVGKRISQPVRDAYC